MTNTKSHAQLEFDILQSTIPDAAILPFKNEILALCDKFGQSGQSGGSAPYTACVISKAVELLLLQQPICEITGHESEWVNVSDLGNELLYQNKRCSALFKNGDGTCSYVDAIVWKGEEEWDTFTGSVYVDNNSWELIRSKQNVKFPFKPKTFYVDVVRVPISKQEAENNNLHYIEGSDRECYYTVLKDPKQLDEVFEYYNKRVC
ncbi:hypothetical protein ACFS6H_19995 [Terrimonas rubra]|uniref:Uncharacterized protein n=1 Tax=Terrimonas rubra TaxID=1035890 RepID=A0ABW6AE45_9BACT